MHRFPTISYLDEQTTKAVRALQKELFTLTGSRACLDLWAPHLTVGDGFAVEDEKLEEFYDDLRKAVSDLKPFKLHLKGFSYLNNWIGARLPEITPNVAYVDIVPNQQLLGMAERLRERLSGKWPKFYQQMWPYTPHVTIAYKDLQDDGLEITKKFLKEKDFDRVTIIDHVALAKEGGDKICNEFKRFPLGS